MVIYRPHLGELEESLAESKEFEDVNQMKEYIVNWFMDFCKSVGMTITPLTVEEIVIDENLIVDDERTGWSDTRYVCITRDGDLNPIGDDAVPQCIGYYATIYNK